MKKSYYHSIRDRLNESEQNAQSMINYLRTAKNLTSKDVDDLHYAFVTIKKQIGKAQDLIIEEMIQDHNSN